MCTLISFFIMIIILAVVLVISTILYSEIKVIRNISNSVISFFAADSGVEKVLYYDRKVVPTGAARGLCSMFDPSNPIDYCHPDGIPNDLSVDHSVYCNPTAGNMTGTDCSPNTCTSCEIDFSTSLAPAATTSSADKKYIIKGVVTPSNFSINSIGYFKNVARAVNLFAK